MTDTGEQAGSRRTDNTAPAGGPQGHLLRAIQIGYLARRLIDLAEGHPVLFHNREAARGALAGHIKGLEPSHPQAAPTPRNDVLSDADIDEIMVEANFIVKRRVAFFHAVFFFAFLTLPVCFYAWASDGAYSGWFQEFAASVIATSAVTGVILFFALPALAWLWKKVSELRTRGSLPVASRGDLPRPLWWFAYNGFGPITWFFGKKTVQLLTPAFLVAVAAFFAAVVNIEIHLNAEAAAAAAAETAHVAPAAATAADAAHAVPPATTAPAAAAQAVPTAPAATAQAAPTDPAVVAAHAASGAAAQEHSSMERFWHWFRAGKEELALAGLLALVAFLLESVISNLTVTRVGLAETAKISKDAAEEARKIQDSFHALHETTTGILADTKEAIDRNSAIAEFMRIFSLADGWGQRARTLQRSGKQLREAFALDLASRRMHAFGETFRDFFKSLSGQLGDRMPASSGGASGGEETLSGADLQNLRHLTVLATAFEAAFGAQKRVFDDSRSEIVAPFEALAGFVANFIDGIMERRSAFRDAKDNPPEIVFYTLLPISPEAFFSQSRWSDDPVGNGVTLNAASDLWVSFLVRLRKAFFEDGPKIYRHFLVVEKEFITDRIAEYADDMKAHQTLEKKLTAMWNPLAHDADADLLEESKIREQLMSKYLTEISPTPNQEASPTRLWRTAKSEVANLPGWGIEISDARKDGLPVAHPKVTLFDALRRYHIDADEDDIEANTLRVLKVSKHNWIPASGDDLGGPDKFLQQVLEQETGEYALVDYFAARVRRDVHEDPDWAFAIRSKYDKDMGVVKMEVLFEKVKDCPIWEEQKRGLNLLFGINAPSVPHIQTMKAFVRGSEVKAGS